MGNIIFKTHMELYNPTTDVMNFAAMEKDIMIAADVEVADLDSTELKRKMTCKSVAKGWKKWVKAVKKHPKYRKATKAQRAKFWKKVALWAVKFDKKHGCGWVKAWKAYCKKSMKKLTKFVKAVKKHPKYLKASKKARMGYWKKVAKKVLKWNKKKQCHLVNKKWKKVRKACLKLRGKK